NDAMYPAMKLPTEAPRNHTPIISDETRAGASFVIALRPTGESVSSPSVWRRYVSTNHLGETSAPPAAASPAPTITTNPSPSRTSPIPNFVGLDGSFPRRPSHTHSAATTGAMVKMNSALSDWNHAAGMTPVPRPGIH